MYQLIDQNWLGCFGTLREVEVPTKRMFGGGGIY